MKNFLKIVLGGLAAVASLRVSAERNHQESNKIQVKNFVVGDGEKRQFFIKHGMKPDSVIVQVVNIRAGFVVDADITHYNDDLIVGFANPPVKGGYRVVIMGEPA